MYNHEVVISEEFEEKFATLGGNSRTGINSQDRVRRGLIDAGDKPFRHNTSWKAYRRNQNRTATVGVRSSASDVVAVRKAFKTSKSFDNFLELEVSFEFEEFEVELRAEKDDNDFQKDLKILERKLDGPYVDIRNFGYQYQELIKRYCHFWSPETLNVVIRRYDAVMSDLSPWWL